MARLLVVMGSGETSPTMTGVHRELFERLGPPTRAIVLDTPVGFQLNADEVTARAIEYFRVSVNVKLEVASYRDRESIDPLEAETALNQIRDARYVFAGPGSPSYALRQWRETPILDLLRTKLENDGCIVFASAAAVTLGRFAVPVYEIYKVGEPVRWEEGLDLLAATGLNAAVIPHFNNAEGGTHDTRYCYLGEHRLARLEEMLPPECFVLGVDEHTACIFDLAARTVTVEGLGAVTVRVKGQAARIEAGTTLPTAGLPGLAGGATPVAEAPEAVAVPDPADSPFWAGVADIDQTLQQALQEGDFRTTTGALLELDDLLWKWSTESFGTDEQQRARAIQRAAIARVGDAAASGAHDHRDLIAPIVEALLVARERARSEDRYAAADAIRDSLANAGVEVRDTDHGTDWVLRQDEG